MTKPHKLYFSIKLTPWTNYFIQYGLYVTEKFVLCHGYKKILQNLNRNLLLLYVCHYAFTLVKQVLGRRQRRFLISLVHPHVLQYFFAVAKEFLAVVTRDFSLSSSDSLFASTSHSSTWSISSVLSIYIF